jgi:hypothetical protein
MKNLSFFKLLFIFLIVLSSFVAKAVIPPVSLPHVFNASDSYGTINMDGNSSQDFSVFFMYTTSGGGSYHSYCQITGISSGNEILSEFEPFPTAPPTAPSLDKTPLSSLGIAFTKILSKGDIIGPLEAPKGGLTVAPLSWYESPYIFQYYNVPASPLGSNFTDNVFVGYLGIHYLGDGGNWYYGWLNVEIDPNGLWVKINSSGSASAADEPVPAGLNDPWPVPIPIIASILGFGLIGGGIYMKRRKKK